MSGNLRQLVLEWARLAHNNPVDAASDAVVQKLFDCAIDDMGDGYAALHAPIAPWRAEGRVLLLGAEQNTTQRVPVAFPYPVIIVGMRPSAQPFRPIPAGTVIADLDDIDVAIDVNGQQQLATSQGVTGVGNALGTNFISLGAIGVQAPVLFGAALKDPTPSLGFTFRWTQAPTPALPAAIFADTFLKVTVFYIPMNPRESANVPPSLRNAP